MKMPLFASSNQEPLKSVLLQFLAQLYFGPEVLNLPDWSRLVASFRTDSEAKRSSYQNLNSGLLLQLRG